MVVPAEEAKRPEWDRQAADRRRDPSHWVETATATVKVSRRYLRPVLAGNPCPEAAEVAAAFATLEGALGRLKAAVPYQRNPA
jgi:hypothetical protein